MLFDSFCLEMEKSANPNILKYLQTYRPGAAASALYREFSILQSYLKRDGVSPELKLAIQRRLDTLNKTEFLIGTYKESLKRFGKKRTPDQHLRVGLQDDLHESTKTEQRALNSMIMSGKLSKQNAAIALKSKVRKRVPSGLDKKFVEHIDEHHGLTDNPAFAQVKKDRELISKILPDYPDANPNSLSISNFAKQANVRMRSVTGSKGRNRSGLAISKKITPIKNASQPIVTRKLEKTIIKTNKAATGSLSNVGMSDPKYLGKIASTLPGLSLLSSGSKRRVRKPKKNENLLKAIRFSFKKPNLIKAPNTKVTKYLQKKGFK